MVSLTKVRLALPPIFRGNTGWWVYLLTGEHEPMLANRTYYHTTLVDHRWPGATYAYVIGRKPVRCAL